MILRARKVSQLIFSPLELRLGMGQELKCDEVPSLHPSSSSSFYFYFSVPREEGEGGAPSRKEDHLGSSLGIRSRRLDLWPIKSGGIAVWGRVTLLHYSTSFPVPFFTSTLFRFSTFLQIGNCVPF